MNPKTHFRRNANYNFSSCGSDDDANYRTTWRPVNCIECIEAIKAAKAAELQLIESRLRSLKLEKIEETQHFLRKHIGQEQSL